MIFEVWLPDYHSFIPQSAPVLPWSVHIRGSWDSTNHTPWVKPEVPLLQQIDICHSFNQKANCREYMLPSFLSLLFGVCCHGSIYWDCKDCTAGLQERLQLLKNGCWVMRRVTFPGGGLSFSLNSNICNLPLELHRSGGKSVTIELLLPGIKFLLSVGGYDGSNICPAFYSCMHFLLEF